MSKLSCQEKCRLTLLDHIHSQVIYQYTLTKYRISILLYFFFFFKIQSSLHPEKQNAYTILNQSIERKMKTLNDVAVSSDWVTQS